MHLFLTKQEKTGAKITNFSQMLHFSAPKNIRKTKFFIGFHKVKKRNAKLNWIQKEESNKEQKTFLDPNNFQLYKLIYFRPMFSSYIYPRKD